MPQLNLLLITVGMNSTNPFRINQHPSNLPEGKRAFGKDITNICKGGLADHPLKKNQSIYFPSCQPQKIEQNKREKDAIHNYHQDICNYLMDFPQKKAQRDAPNTQINDKMRQILIDWIVDVHQSFQLKDQTLFLTFKYLEEYQRIASISKEDYQLVGTACLWIASKYEEIYPPRMKDFVDVTANAYSKSQLKVMESKIIEALRFNLNRVTPLALLSTLELEQFNNQEHCRCLNLARYVLEMSYLSGSIPRKYDTKTMVLAAVKLADAVCTRNTNIGYLICELGSANFYGCYKEMCLLLQVENKYRLTAIKRKYHQEKYNSVGKISIQFQT